MSTVNLYDVLNVTQDATRKEIKDAYRDLVKQFHPDKPTGDADMFDLITHSYNILNKSETREEYDQVYKLSKQSSISHKTLKDQATNFYEAQKNDVTNKKSDKEVEKEFKAAFSDMDRKHKYNRTDDDKIAKKDAKRRLQDLEVSREQEDIELTHEQLFQDGEFNLAKFNAAFDAMHSGLKDMVVHNGNPSAWNAPTGVGGLDTNYSSLDTHGELYVEDEDHLGLDGQNLSSIKYTGSSSKKKLTKEDIKNINSASYTEGHKQVNVDDFNKMFMERMAEREIFDNKLEDRTMGDFDTDPSCGGYGMLNQLGLDKISSVTWDNNDEDIHTRYSRLLEMRKKDDMKE